MTQAQPLIQTLPMTLGAPMSDDPSNPTAIEIPLQIELPNGQTLFAAVALGGLPFDGQRQIAERITAAWNAFTGVTTEEIKAPVKCLHQIAEPVPTETARAEFEAFSKFSKCEWRLDWDKAGFYSDANTDAAFIWFMHGYMRSPRAAAPQAVQPAVPTDADIDAGMQAFDWDGWIDQDKAKRAFTREALARWATLAHPAEGVPAQAWPSNWRETIERAAEKVKDCCAYQLSDDLCALLAAAKPAAQGLEQDAERWGEVLRHVGAAPHFGGQHFTLNTLQAPVTALGFKANLMSGSVAQHFTKAIDAERAAQAKQGGA